MNLEVTPPNLEPEDSKQRVNPEWGGSGILSRNRGGRGGGQERPNLYRAIYEWPLILSHIVSQCAVYILVSTCSIECPTTHTQCTISKCLKCHSYLHTKWELICHSVWIATVWYCLTDLYFNSLVWLNQKTGQLSLFGVGPIVTVQLNLTWVKIFVVVHIKLTLLHQFGHKERQINNRK